jgi:hypothetical protein
MLKGHKAAPGFEAIVVALAPDGTWLATASQDRTVKLWKTMWKNNEAGRRLSTQAFLNGNRLPKRPTLPLAS